MSGIEGLSEEKLFLRAMKEAADRLVDDMESYRQKNVNKYHAEKKLEFAEYTKMERYKNRVRIVDAVLPAIKLFITRVNGSLSKVVSPIDLDNIE